MPDYYDIRSVSVAVVVSSGCSGVAVVAGVGYSGVGVCGCVEMGELHT